MMKMTTQTILLATILVCGSVVAQPYQAVDYTLDLPINSIKVFEPTAPFTNVMDVLSNTRTVEEVKRTTQYFDGLGRPLQTVSWQASPLKKDLVTPQVYDAMGRQSYGFLPYVQQGVVSNNGQLKYDAFSQQQTFNTTQYSGQGETYFYSQTIYETNPLGRPSKAMAPGNNWVGAARGVTQEYKVNAVDDEVRLWTIGYNATDMPLSTTTYPAGELYKGVTIDEHGKQVVEFKNKQGQIILKKVQIASSVLNDHAGWLSTYYIYDDFSRLRWVIQPKGIKLLENDDWVFANTPAAGATVRDELCFYYRYDAEGRMIVKKVPGAGEVYMVYDRHDRLLLTQDANLRAQGKWLVMHYDGLNRPIQTGLWQSGLTLAQQQAAAIAATGDYPFAVTAMPSSGYELLSQTGYDSYTNLPSASGLGANLVTTHITAANFEMGYHTAPLYAQPIVATAAVKGLPTWGRVKILDGAATPSFLYTVTIYDDKGRTIQTQSKNSSGGTDIVTQQYDFIGKVIRTHQSHEKAGVNAATYLVVTKPAYDHMGRLLTRKKKISSGSYTGQEKTTITNTYNELGQLWTKGLGMVSGNTTPLESLTYDYNIRGWLLGANRDYIKGTNSTNYFGFELAYDKVANIISGQNYAAQQYNGNITGSTWKAKGDGEVRRYDFAYDNANRLTGADFNQYTGGSFNKNAGIDFSVSGLTYDGNGNILTMNQKGWKLNGSSSFIDQLTYTYIANTNKLLRVTDVSNDNNSKLGDFKYDAATKTTTDYSYDVNGNMVADNNKKISGIAYNFLNLPQNITVTSKGSIEYVYDAGGNKLKKIVKETGHPNKNTEYIGGFVYEDDVLQLLGHEEGRVRPVLASGQLTDMVFDYFLKDHLGNTRTVITEEQQVDKYPVASLEPAKLATEQNYYAIATGQITDASTISGLPAYTNDNGIGNNPVDATFSAANSTKLYRLNGNDAKTGLGIVLKVMAGDKIDIFGRSFYNQAVTGNGTCTNCGLTVNNIVTAFIGGATSSTSTHGIPTSLELEGTAGTGITNILQAGQNTQAANNGNRPKAFINYILLDEQFKYAGGGASLVSDVNTLKQHYPDLQNIAIPKNGYIYVYCSNESNINVFFDNIQVVHTRGALLEETQYYPFGLVMKGISSKAAGKVENRYKYNGKEEQCQEFSDGSGLEWLDYGARMYDKQIGRWGVLDNKAELLEMSSPYVFSLNNPIVYKDPDGDLPILINGKVSSDDERGSEKYWSEAIIATIGYSGIPNPSGQMMFVDGDRHAFSGVRYSQRYWPAVKNGCCGISANDAGMRYSGGYEQAHIDFKDILSKLTKDPKTGKIIEKIQIYTHSRGAAFGAGYAAALLDEIKANADLFEDPNSVIEFIYNMAPNESWEIDSPVGIDAYSHHHNGDWLSGNSMGRLKAAFSSKETIGGFFGAHSIKSFNSDLQAFIAAFVSSNGDSTKVIEDFVKKMKDDYDITVTVK